MCVGKSLMIMGSLDSMFFLGDIVSAILFAYFFLREMSIYI